jgi:hypothetical protein
MLPCRKGGLVLKWMLFRLRGRKPVHLTVLDVMARHLAYGFLPPFISFPCASDPSSLTVFLALGTVVSVAPSRHNLFLSIMHRHIYPHNLFLSIRIIYPIYPRGLLPPHAKLECHTAVVQEQAGTRAHRHAPRSSERKLRRTKGVRKNW